VSAQLPDRLKLSYSLHYGKLMVGTTTRTLTRAKDGWQLVSRTVPRGLGKLLEDGALTEHGRFMMQGRQIQPLEYRQEKESDKDYLRMVRFDWTGGKLHYRDGHSEALRPGTQDSGTLVFELMLNPPAAGEQHTVAVTDGRWVSHYRYRLDGEETLKTEIGKLRTLRVLREKDGGKNRFMVWLAPERGYLPVRIESARDGKPSTVLELEAVEGM
jgi:hypothetical protein